MGLVGGRWWGAAALLVLLARLDAAPLVPPQWTAGLVYAHSFDADAPEVNLPGWQVHNPLRAADGGFHRRCGEPVKLTGQDALVLTAKDESLSPQRPLAVLFWWSLPADLPPQGGFDLLYLHGRGFVSTFLRGGPWCGLADTAAVVQVYNLPGISNVNGIYDTAPRTSLGLKAGEWHHCAVVIAASSLVSVYTDGRKVFETRTQGRTFSADDGFRQLKLGGPVRLDEVLVLRQVPAADELADYAPGLRCMRAAYGW